MPKPITFVLAVVLGAGLTGGLASPSLASVASNKKQFCAAVSKAGGSTPFAQAATSGEGTAGLVASLQSLGRVAPSQRLKSDLKTLAILFRRLGRGENVSDLGAKTVAKLTSAMTSFSTFAAARCTSATSPSTAAVAGGLSGTWSGQYAGAGQGTFTITWQQSGSDLTGTIKISDVGVPISISGTLSGNTIRFGTVGSSAITYSGSVSGNTMSGTYQTPTGDGTWNATKAS
jgi:hypothetical protein